MTSNKMKDRPCTTTIGTQTDLTEVVMEEDAVVEDAADTVTKVAAGAAKAVDVPNRSRMAKENNIRRD